MNLIDVFESTPFQDVGTFNSLFVESPILGFPSSAEVEIGSLASCGRRRVSVDGQELLLELNLSYKAKKEKQAKPRFVKREKVAVSLPSVYKELSPPEFMIYSAVKELGGVEGVQELVRHISLTTKTVYNSLPRLEKLGLVKSVKTEHGTRKLFV